MDRQEKAVAYSATDQMVVAAAHQLKDDDIVYVGTGITVAAILLAKYTHAPNCTVIMENGLVRDSLFPLPFATDSLGTQTMADQLTSQLNVMCLGQSGHIGVGFIGAGQIDRYGNVNDTVVGDYFKPVHRWPGSGGANDIMSFCKRTIIVTMQSRRRFPEKVDFVTCPGYLDGKPGRREEIGLRPDTGPSTVITNLGIYAFEKGEMVLKSIHAGVGVTLEQIKAEVGWDLKVSSDLQETEPPTMEEMLLFRQAVDPNKIWSGGKRAAWVEQGQQSPAKNEATPGE